MDECAVKNGDCQQKCVNNWPRIRLLLQSELRSLRRERNGRILYTGIRDGHSRYRSLPQQENVPSYRRSGAPAPAQSPLCRPGQIPLPHRIRLGRFRKRSSARQVALGTLSLRNASAPESQCVPLAEDESEGLSVTWTRSS